MFCLGRLYSMNVLFLTLIGFETLEERSIYTDLLREFVKKGHEIFAISPVEKRKKVKTHVVREGHSTILRLQIGNTQKTNVLEKGISTVMIEPTFRNAIKKYFSDVKFDLILYSTPPITLVSSIEYVRARDGAKTYLLLKDIFPQNAVDMGMMSTKGVKSILYKHFRKQEKKLYELSDRIGCMSQANVDYVKKNNPEVSDKVEVCPNSIEVIDKSVASETREIIRKKYNIPRDRKVFVYGGNLGKPQGIPYIIECLKGCTEIKDAFFLIVGDGTEYEKLEKYINSSDQTNVKLMKRIPKEDYDSMVGACDVGLLFLDHRFSLPNYPSRLLSYMQAKIPVLACTDINTDIGKDIMNGGFGWWCESDNIDGFIKLVKECICTDTVKKGIAGYDYLTEHFNVEKAYQIICDKEIV